MLIGTGRRVRRRTDGRRAISVPLNDDGTWRRLLVVGRRPLGRTCASSGSCRGRRRNLVRGTARRSVSVDSSCLRAGVVESRQQGERDCEVVAGSLSKRGVVRYWNSVTR